MYRPARTLSIARPISFLRFISPSQPNVPQNVSYPVMPSTSLRMDPRSTTLEHSNHPVTYQGIERSSDRPRDKGLQNPVGLWCQEIYSISSISMSVFAQFCIPGRHNEAFKRMWLLKGQCTHALHSPHPLVTSTKCPCNNSTSVCPQWHDHNRNILYILAPMPTLHCHHFKLNHAFTLDRIKYCPLILFYQLIMSLSHNYVCSAEVGCNQTFVRFVDLKRHEATHSPNGYICDWPGCDFATLMKTSYDIHYARHTGEQRYICPHDGCDYKTHDPALFTRHRKKRHGYVPQARGRGATGSGRTQSASSSPQPQAQPPAVIPSSQSLPQPAAPFHQYQYQSSQFQPQLIQFEPQPTQLQPQPPQPVLHPQPIQSQPHAAQFQLQPVQFQPQPQPQPPQPTQLQLQPQPAQSRPRPIRPRPRPIQPRPQFIQSQPPPAVYNQSLGILYGPTNIVDEYTIYTGPAKASHGWTEGCMCPELMQRRPSEILECGDLLKT